MTERLEALKNLAIRQHFTVVRDLNFIFEFTLKFKTIQYVCYTLLSYISIKDMKQVHDLKNFA